MCDRIVGPALAGSAVALDVLPCPAPTKPDSDPEAMQANGTDDFTAKCNQQVDKPRPKPRQWERETPTVGDKLRDGTPVFHSENRVLRVGAKKAPVGGTGAIG
jgi:hypothetical protein